MAKIRVEIEIDASPNQVRDVVLGFKDYPQWHTAFINGLSTIPPEKDPHTLQPGDNVALAFNGGTVTPTILSNTPREFCWQGGVMAGALAGKHYFIFEDSDNITGGCKFTHGEDYYGWMTWLFGEGILGVGRKSVEGMFRGYCEDLKKRAEELKS